MPDGLVFRTRFSRRCDQQRQFGRLLIEAAHLRADDFQ